MLLETFKISFKIFVIFILVIPNTRSSVSNNVYTQSSRLSTQVNSFPRIGTKICNKMPMSLRKLPKIECVHLTSSNSQIQNKRATKGFILIRHKRYQIYTCLQLSSSIASFVWKSAHFELRSYGGA